MTIELDLKDAINIMHALAFASRSAKREDDQDALYALYDRFDGLIKGTDRQKAGSKKGE